MCPFLGSHVYCGTHNEDLDKITVLDAHAELEKACGRVNDRFLASVEHFFWKLIVKDSCVYSFLVYSV